LADAGISTFVGGLFESGWARAANVTLAGLTSQEFPSDLIAPSTYSDLPDFAMPVPEAGQLAIARHVGVAGSAVDLGAALSALGERITVHEERLVAGSEEASANGA
jgi:hypothetical protein